MGTYLNPGAEKFIMDKKLPIYVDKSGIISELNKYVLTGMRYLCISRPRRFGKTMAADMISAYYDKTIDDADLFDGLKITEDSKFNEYKNKFDVIKINIQDFISESSSIDDALDLLKRSILWELDFLRDWLKDKAYVALCYMTGILPIKKYGTNSALNMFEEFSMENPKNFAEFVGFTEKEVRTLCKKYHMDLSECQNWYNGYSFLICKHVYSPKSIISALTYKTFDDYWTRTETYEALKIYIDMNFDGLKDTIISLMSGDRKRIDTGSFQNDMTTFLNADDVLTLLVHLGYLGYDYSAKEVFIPNQEILHEFIIATTTDNSWSEVVKSVRKSDELLEATWNHDEGKVAEIIEEAHLETSHLQYNDENALSYTISLAYYSARKYYSLVREFPSGKGFADIVFLPLPHHSDKPAIVVELKWNKNVESAISQIKEKQYPERLKGYENKLILVGINYDKKSKKHICRIENSKSL